MTSHSTYFKLPLFLLHTFVVFFMTCFVVACSQKQVPADKPSSGVELPSVFDNGDRIYLKIPTVNGDTIKVYTDTGGGFTAIYPGAIERLNLDAKIQTEQMDNEELTYIYAADIIDNPIYHPIVKSNLEKIISAPFYFVPPIEFVKNFNAEDDDGFFGQYFFMNKVWTFDYLNQKVFLHDQLQLNEEDANTQKVGFKKNMMGKKIFGHPSFTMKVDGEEIDMLYDTGATFTLSDSARQQFNGRSEVGGSFIAKSVFEKWKKEHEDWPIIKGGDVISEGGQAYGFDMIQVPIVTLGDIDVGPVWFSMRRDEAWSEWMIQSMDKVVKGALGGSAFKYTTTSIDYKNDLVSFSQN